MPSNSSDDPTDLTSHDEPTDGEESSAAESPTSAAKPTGKAAKVATAKKAAAQPKKTVAADDATDASASNGDISLTISKSMLKKVAAGVLVVALIAVIGVGVWQWVEKSRQLSAFDDVKSASEKYVTALISTLNTDQAANSKEILGPLSTGDLRARLEKDRADTEKSVTDLKLKVTAKIYFSAVESFDNSSAKTVVLAEASGTSAQAPSGASNTMVLRLGLRHEDGKWLVSSVDGLPGNSSGKIDPSQSLPATTTSAPASTPAG
ncbi:DUF3176 domain-containing protein [Gordonia sp. TBRC 11910]|uniref:DUF3176 domain-containing protein n=1 Tax=Gordonia asplenii TaxID=2725283 RepID=A0A848L9F1_9ACTN|nr:DUF3176 domain-containing protein [Gordonia asplenii]NMO04208.1 DUF3176 domain-containing protein [Gordonia asplenii]